MKTVGFMRSTLIALAVAMVPSVAGAVILFEKGKSTPVRGYLVKQDAVQVIVDEVLPDGRVERRELPRTAIEDLIVSVDSSRLAALTPDKPEAYRDYAEELAEKREDPDARAAAIRLYLIAAYLKPKELGRSALLGMTSLARSSREERAFRAMAFLLDGKHDLSLLAEPVTSSLDPESLPQAGRGALKNLLRLVRTRRKTESLEMLNRPAVKELLPWLAPAITESELRSASEYEGSLSAPLLRKILDAELALEGPAARSESNKPDRPTTWAQPIARGETRPVASLQLESLTEFDPRECRYRDGKWLRSPDSAPAGETAGKADEASE